MHASEQQQQESLQRALIPPCTALPRGWKVSDVFNRLNRTDSIQLILNAIVQLNGEGNKR